MIRKEAGKLLPVFIDFFKATSGSFPQGTWLEGSAGFWNYFYALWGWLTAEPASHQCPALDSPQLLHWANTTR